MELNFLMLLEVEALSMQGMNPDPECSVDKKVSRYHLILAHL